MQGELWVRPQPLSSPHVGPPWSQGSQDPPTCPFWPLSRETPPLGGLPVVTSFSWPAFQKCQPSQKPCDR